ncbi:MAG TPA: DUF4160 domain-containing protein [Gemmatimonadales bacterium]|nr:DUF4160 domain-containing protein [Gemmatimonadales bacterium]
MPVILRAGGFTVHIYYPPREHPPPHVHVRTGKAGEVVIVLGAGGTPPTIRRRQRGGDIRLEWRALQLVAEHNQYLLRAWRRLHGPLETDL